MVAVLSSIQLTDPDKKRSESTAPQVLSGGPVNDSRLTNYQWPIRYSEIRCIRRAPTIKLAKWAIFSQMLHTPWDYYNINNKATKEMLDLVKETFQPIRDQFLLQSCFGALDFGWQPFEVVYRPENGYIYIDTLKALLQDYTTILVYMDTGRFAGFVNETFGFNKFDNASMQVDEQYAQNITFEFEGTDWYGESVYQSIQPIMSSWDSVQASANRYDTKIAGATWVIYYPVGETTYNGIKQKNHVIALSILRDLEASGSVAIPDEIQDSFDELVDKDSKGKWRIELVEAKNSNQVGFVDRQKYLDSLLIRAFGLTERSLMEGKHGTKEEADVHADVSLSTIDSRHRLICNQLSLYAVANFMQLNFGKKMRYEVGIRPAPLVDAQIKLIKEVYSRLIQNPDISVAERQSLDMNALRTQLNLPVISGEFIPVIQKSVEPKTSEAQAA